MTPMTTKKPPTLGQSCGSRSGYNAHYRRGETACSDCKLAHREYGIEWRAKNPEIVKEMGKRDRNKRRKAMNEYGSKWRKANPEKMKEIYKKARLKNPEKNAQNARIRRARKRNSLCIPYTVDEVLTKYGSNCHICSKPIDLQAPKRVGRGEWQMGLHIDHLIPISHNGADTLENVRPSHAICNMTRGTKSLQ